MAMTASGQLLTGLNRLAIALLAAGVLMTFMVSRTDGESVWALSCAPLLSLLLWLLWSTWCGRVLFRSKIALTPEGVATVPTIAGTKSVQLSSLSRIRSYAVWGRSQVFTSLILDFPGGRITFSNANFEFPDALEHFLRGFVVQAGIPVSRRAKVELGLVPATRAEQVRFALLPLVATVTLTAVPVVLNALLRLIGGGFAF